ncbi:hypothetical protein HKX42_09010 [Salinisphaera sp. USBA-960]|uniref:chorismate transformation enzyme, FkbO/Hyg5 family n=1 Tax=Salinisphaera orenii TaxID=856731 RepID=UPI000DBE865C|nr:hypothetical protein [Salifodinibacter halophilus]NNC27013.1 hypothetical protein [Salifodinibacter halophilus]
MACDWAPNPAISDAHKLAAVAFDPDTPNLFDVPLSWLTGDWQHESWSADTPVEELWLGDWQVRRTPDLAFAAVELPESRLASPAALEAAALTAYRELFALQTKLGFAHLQRVWHWLFDVIGGEGETQRYRSLCRGRAQAVDEVNIVLPPATGVDSARPGLRIQAILGCQPITPIENPRQVSAYRYPREHGRRAPAFARAAETQLGRSRYLLISGTASIIGHRTYHAGDVRRQTREAVANIAAVIGAASRSTAARGLDGLAGARGYVPRAADAEIVAAELRALMPKVPITLLQAELCRPDLSVEIEAQMRL